MRLALALLFLVSLVPAAHAQSAWNEHCAPGVRWDFQLCRELEPSGPGKGTLHQGNWGTAFFLRKSPIEVTQTPSDKKVTTEAGVVSGRPALDGGYTLTHEVTGGSSRELRLRPSGQQDLTIELDRERYELDRGPHGLTVRFGEKSLTYERTSTGFTVTGPQGKVTYSRDLSGTEVITSAAGESRFEQSPYTGSKISGIPVEKHPHLGRVLLFSIANTGLMLDLWGLAGIAPGDSIASAMYWRPALAFGDAPAPKSQTP